MKPSVTLRKAGWTAAFPHLVTGKRRQVVVESEEAGWILIKASSSRPRQSASRPSAPAQHKQHEGACPRASF